MNRFRSIFGSEGQPKDEQINSDNFQDEKIERTKTTNPMPRYSIFGNDQKFQKENQITKSPRIKQPYPQKLPVLEDIENRTGKDENYWEKTRYEPTVMYTMTKPQNKTKSRLKYVIFIPTDEKFKLKYLPPVSLLEQEESVEEESRQNSGQNGNELSKDETKESLSSEIESEQLKESESDESEKSDQSEEPPKSESEKSKKTELDESEKSDQSEEPPKSETDQSESEQSKETELDESEKSDQPEELPQVLEKSESEDTETATSSNTITGLQLRPIVRDKKFFEKR